jgi:hypothetical protein
MSWLKEDKIILNLSKISRDEKIQKIIRNLERERINWDYLFEASKKKGVFSIVYHHLKLKNKVIPLDVEKKFQDLYSENACRNLILSQEFQEVLKILKNKNIPVIVLKGMYLGEKIYKNIALRPMSDIDILIKKESLEEFDAAVKKIGFKTSHNYRKYLKSPDSIYLNTMVYEKKKGKVSIFLHLHWHIVNSTLPIFEKVMPYIEMEKIWKQALEVKIAGIETLSLSYHHQVIYLCLHAFNHSLDRNILLCDISEFININRNKIDWNLLIKDAFDFKINRIVYCVLYLTKLLLNMQVPDYLLSSLKPGYLSYGERKFMDLVLNNAQFPQLSAISYFFMLDDLSEKLKFLIKIFFPPKTMLEQRFSLSSVKPTFFVKIARIGRGLKEAFTTLLLYFLKLILEKNIPYQKRRQKECSVFNRQTYF